MNWDKVVGYGIVIILVLCAISFAFMIAKLTTEIGICAKEFGGVVVQGYCTYTENGTSQSYKILENYRK